MKVKYMVGYLRESLHSFLFFSYICYMLPFIFFFILSFTGESFSSQVQVCVCIFDGRESFYEYVYTFSGSTFFSPFASVDLYFPFLNKFSLCLKD